MVGSCSRIALVRAASISIACISFLKDSRSAASNDV
nr:MAG TPA: hypothetical protein [Caudoviricetes sp.]